MPTIRQLAKLAGVSISTVSRALSGHPYVNEELRARILALAESYHYAPNRYSQGAMSGKSGLLGIIISDTSSEYHSQLLKGMLERCFTDSYRAVILETNCDVNYTCQTVNLMTEQRVEGVIIASGHDEQIPRSALLTLRSHEIPLVILDNTAAGEPVERVRTDEQALAELAVAHLTALGHQRIAFVDPGGQPGSALRKAAVREALAQRNLPCDLVFPAVPPADVAQCADELLAVSPRPTAVIAFNDIAAAGVMKTLFQRGYRVPGDISVMGCGNLHFTTLLLPELTTIEQYPERVGKEAVRLLLRRVEERQYLNENAKDHLIAPALIVRDSCAPCEGV